MFVDINDSEPLTLNNFVLGDFPKLKLTLKIINQLFSDIYFSSGLQISNIQIDTKKCPNKELGFCNNGILCPNLRCVLSHQFCDNVNNCGDWLVKKQKI